MWITSYITKRHKAEAATSGSVINSDVSGVEVSASRRYREVPICAPYGVVYVPPVGEEAVMVHTPSADVCMGVIASAPESLEAGELMLCSKGGASIILKNNGSVLINGKEFGGA